MTIDAALYTTIAGSAATQYTIPLVSFYPSPTNDDYNFGSIVRYFARATNFHDATVIEVNQQMYNKVFTNHFYLTAIVTWRISGPDTDKFDSNGIRIITAISKSNQMAINQAALIIPNISTKLINVYEFWRGV